MLKQQRFGVEIELAGIPGGKAAEIIAEYFNSSLTILPYLKCESTPHHAQCSEYEDDPGGSAPRYGE